jgi:predicted  nucleic acid-binding Zn-ribbon protein
MKLELETKLQKLVQLKEKMAQLSQERASLEEEKEDQK